MIIDNKKTTIGIKLKKRVLILLLLISVISFFALNLFHHVFWGISGLEIVIILCGIIIVYHILSLVRDYHYFYFSDQGIKLVFRFYATSALFRKPASIEIKKDTFYKFQIEKELLGLKKYLILYQKTPKGVAKFPPISISLLNKVEELKLSDSLSKLSQ